MQNAKCKMQNSKCKIILPFLKIVNDEIIFVLSEEANP